MKANLRMLNQLINRKESEKGIKKLNITFNNDLIFLNVNLFK